MNSLFLIAVTLVTLLGLCDVTLAEVECWDYCTGGGDTDCDGRRNVTTCMGIGCKISRVVGTDIYDRQCVYENDPEGVYLNRCWSGVYFGIQIVSCQYDCENDSRCNEEFKEVTCMNYCEGDDDPTGYCQSRHTIATCTGVGCRRTWWKGSDMYDSSCLTEDDTLGQHFEACYDANYQGNDIRTCQCITDECNSSEMDGALNKASSVEGVTMATLLSVAVASLIL